MNSRIKFKLQLFIRSLLIIVTFTTACEKNDIKEFHIIAEKQDVLMNWGQSANGRWIPYLLNKAKSENKNSDVQYVISVFSSYLHTLNNVKSAFRTELLTELNLDLKNHPDILDRIYRANYETINSNLGENGTMDKLWENYLTIQNTLKADKGNNMKKMSVVRTSSTDIPSVEVSACDIKTVFDLYFVDINIIPTLDNTSLPDLLNMTDASVHGCGIASLAAIGLVLGNVYSLQNPTSSECAVYGNEIEVYLQQYLNCPSDNSGNTDGDGNGSGDSGGGTTPPPDPYPPIDPPEGPSEEDINAHVFSNPFALFGDLDCFLILQWLATATYEVENDQINKLNSIRMSTSQTPWLTSAVIAKVQDINNAHSAVVNMDYFPVRITQLPILNGQRLTAPQFIEHIRKNINSFVNTDKAEFIPYNYLGINDADLWNSNNPLNAVIGIDIAGLFGPGDEVFDDDGAVIVSKHGVDGWTFTTIFDPIYGSHPVSGNRDFGYVHNADGSYTFYTRGVDRLTYALATMLQNVTQKPFRDTDELWSSFQNGINTFVNNNGGSSQVDDTVIERPKWQQIKDVLDGKLPLSTLSSDCK